MSRILIHIIDRLPPDGAERLLVEILRYRSAHYKCEVLCLVEGGPLVSELEKIGVPVTILGKRRGVDLKHAWELYRWLSRKKPQIVHTHLFTADTWGRGCAWLARIPGIFSTVHSTNAWKSSIHLSIDRVLASASNLVIACSAEVGQHLSEQGIPQKRLATVANGVDLQRIEAAPRADLQSEFGISADAMVFALVGRLHQAKGHADLLPVLAQLESSAQPFTVLFIGEGELETQLKASVTSLGLEAHVRFTGFRADVIELLKAVNYLLMPSRWEGLPMTLLESMACGTPALASRVGGIPEVIEHGENGYLYDPGDADALLEQLQALITEQGVRESMRLSAKNTIAQSYNAESVARAYEALYEKVEL